MDTGGGVGNVAVIGRGMVIKGDITSKESLRIDGEVDGSLDLFDCQLTVGREGRVGANASAREIELLGTVRGNLEATSKITIRKGARLIGDLRAPGILIEEGAYVKGKIEIINTDEPAEINATQPTIKQQAAGS
jgi:cytoskeletal protein CcmA (bactofilin family)